jgi:hypothetical protein
MLEVEVEEVRMERLDDSQMHSVLLAWPQSD